MAVQPKAALGLVGGMVFGAWIGAKSQSLLNPAHGVVYGLATLITAYVVNQIIKKYYGEKYEGIPNGIRVLSSMCVSTLIVGAIAADSFGVHLSISVALKILIGSLFFGGLGWMLGKNASELDPAPLPSPAGSVQPL